MSNNFAPIALFAYSRLEHLMQTVSALQKNTLAPESELFIFCDGPKNDAVKQKVGRVRQFVTTIDGFKSITIYNFEINNGLAKSIIQGVTQLINQYGRVIVLEDDLVTTPNFLSYMNDALNYYEKKEKVWSVAGCNLPFTLPKDYLEDVYFFPRTSSWGWATWKDRWNKAHWTLTGKEAIFHSRKLQRKFNRGGDDMYPLLKQMLRGEVNSWAIIWEYYEMLHNCLTVWPVSSKVFNIGLDGTGQHGDKKRIHFQIDKEHKSHVFVDVVEENAAIAKNRLSYTNGHLFRRIKVHMKRGFVNLFRKLHAKNSISLNQDTR